MPTQRWKKTICHAQNLLNTNFIGQLKQTVTYMTKPKYAQRHTQLNAPIRNKQNPYEKQNQILYLYQSQEYSPPDDISQTT